MRSSSCRHSADVSVDRIGIRVANPADTDAIVDLVNRAYLVEAFFVAGDRISHADVEALIARQQCLVAVDAAGRIVGCVEVSVHDGRGYFGMLAVANDVQGQGLGRRLIAAAEDRARAAGCRVMDIKVVNLRAELFPYYERLGYRRTGTGPYVHRPVLQPCHMVLMEKPLDV
jgi:ribosomal protein S18 acetylase RimI-like enzyme